MRRTKLARLKTRTRDSCWWWWWCWLRTKRKKLCKRQSCYGLVMKGKGHWHANLEIHLRELFTLSQPKPYVRNVRSSRPFRPSSLGTELSLLACFAFAFPRLFWHGTITYFTFCYFIFAHEEWHGLWTYSKLEGNGTTKTHNILSSHSLLSSILFRGQTLFNFVFPYSYLTFPSFLFSF